MHAQHLGSEPLGALQRCRHGARCGWPRRALRANRAVVAGRTVGTVTAVDTVGAGRTVIAIGTGHTRRTVAPWWPLLARWPLLPLRATFTAMTRRTVMRGARDSDRGEDDARGETRERHKQQHTHGARLIAHVQRMQRIGKLFRLGACRV